jgi:hypothetical protein
MPCDARGAQVGERHRGGVENGVAGWLAAYLLLCSPTRTLMQDRDVSDASQLHISQIVFDALYLIVIFREHFPASKTVLCRLALTVAGDDRRAPCRSSALLYRLGSLQRLMLCHPLEIKPSRRRTGPACCSRLA